MGKVVCIINLVGVINSERLILLVPVIDGINPGGNLLLILSGLTLTMLRNTRQKVKLAEN